MGGQSSSAQTFLVPGGAALANRRSSDSHQSLIRPIISVSLVDDENNEECPTPGQGSRRRANSYSPLMSNSNNNESSEDIVCSTGELMSLKCLSHSAVEMRALHNHEFLAESDYLLSGSGSGGGTSSTRRGSLFYSTGNNNYANQHLYHQRSKSFDASVNKKSPTAKSNLLSGLLNRIRQVAVSTSTNTGGSNSSTNASNTCPPTSNGTAPPTTPVSTALVVDSSGCGATTVTITPTTPVSNDDHSVSQNDASKKEGGIPWDNNTGYFLDASMLGLAIENHLKKGDNKGQKRRATFCTLSETNSQLLGQPPNSQTSGQLPWNRPRSASAYSVLPLFHSAISVPVADPDMGNRRRESIASVFPSSSSKTGFMQGNRRNSSFTPGTDQGPRSPDQDPYYLRSPQQEEIVGSFIKTSMTSELYSEGEVIVEEEQLDIDNYDNQTQIQPPNQNRSTRNTRGNESGSGFLGGIDFWSKKPTETIINFISSGGTDSSDSTRFANVHRVSVATINEEEEDGGEQGQAQPPLNTFCGFFRKVIMQFINSLFRS